MVRARFRIAQEYSSRDNSPSTKRRAIASASGPGSRPSILTLAKPYATASARSLRSFASIFPFFVTFFVRLFVIIFPFAIYSERLILLLAKSPKANGRFVVHFLVSLHLSE